MRTSVVTGSRWPPHTDIVKARCTANATRKAVAEREPQLASGTMSDQLLRLEWIRAVDHAISTHRDNDDFMEPKPKNLIAC